MSRVHDPTVGDQTRRMRDTIRALNLDVPWRPYGDEFVREYVAALQERLDDNRIQLADLADRMRHFGPTASTLALKVSLELEVAECERALGEASGG